MKETAEAICDFYKAMREGKFPLGWKEAHLTASHENNEVNKIS